MNASARLVFDRDYFTANYDDWLKRRSKLRRYAIPLASTLLLSGVVMAVSFRQQWLVGVLIACAGIYELVEALTHKSRWINARLKTTRSGKTVDIQLSEHEMTTTSSNGTTTLKMSAFDVIIPATNGVFLIPESGVSIYIPRSSVVPGDKYIPLVEAWLASRRDGKM